MTTTKLEKNKNSNQYDWSKFYKIQSNLEQLIIKNNYFLSGIANENKYIAN